MSIINSLFNNISRIGNDSGDITNKNILNTHASNYMLENYSIYSPVVNAINLATNQPDFFFSGSRGGGISSNVIDNNTYLKFSKQTKPREKVSSQERLFLTVPYLGKGPANIEVESQIKTGDINSKRKSANPNSEISYINYSYYPLIPSIEATISNPANLIEDVASNNWVRGGISSRVIHRESVN